MVIDQPELDGCGSVADGVGDQLADDQFGDEDGLLRQPPRGELFGGQSPGVGDEGRVRRQVPDAHLAGMECLELIPPNSRLLSPWAGTSLSSMAYCHRHRLLIVGDGRSAGRAPPPGYEVNSPTPYGRKSR
ncbi:hypothetical protein GCM10010193_44270 [Kitasatospora atroaurantiaca]